MIGALKGIPVVKTGSSMEIAVGFQAFGAQGSVFNPNLTLNPEP